MKIKINIRNLIWGLFAVAFALTLVLSPKPAAIGCIRGLLLCGRVLIPSLFPFTVCMLFIARSGILSRLELLNPVSKAVFGLNSAGLSVMLLSFVGGYPVGARLLSAYSERGECDPEKAGLMLNCCINAGPAFVISAIGSGILGSEKIGIILFVCHIIASLIIRFILRISVGGFEINEKCEKSQMSPADNFVASVAESSEATLSICFFVLLFSVISEYLSRYSSIKLFRVLESLLEVTNAVAKTDNIYFIAFLLGFGGLSVWCQIAALCGKIKIGFPRFVLFRILHGVLSTVLVYSVLSLTHTALPAFSNNTGFDGKLLYSNAALGTAMLIMGIIFVISLTSKKYAGKILDDVV